MQAQNQPLVNNQPPLQAQNQHLRQDNNWLDNVYKIAKDNKRKEQNLISSYNFLAKNMYKVEIKENEFTNQNLDFIREINNLVDNLFIELQKFNLPEEFQILQNFKEILKESVTVLIMSKIETLEETRIRENNLFYKLYQYIISNKLSLKNDVFNIRKILLNLTIGNNADGQNLTFQSYLNQLLQKIIKTKIIQKYQEEKRNNNRNNQ